MPGAPPSLPILSSDRCQLPQAAGERGIRDGHRTQRPAARRLDGDTLREVHRLYGSVAQGNTVVIQQELARQEALMLGESG